MIMQEISNVRNAIFKYDADEGKNIFFQEEMDKFLRENLYEKDYLELRLALENDLNAFKSWQTIVSTHLANTSKRYQ